MKNSLKIFYADHFLETLLFTLFHTIFDRNYLACEFCLLFQLFLFFNFAQFSFVFLIILKFTIIFANEILRILIFLHFSNMVFQFLHFSFDFWKELFCLLIFYTFSSFSYDFWKELFCFSIFPEFCKSFWSFSCFCMFFNSYVFWIFDMIFEKNFFALQFFLNFSNVFDHFHVFFCF